MLREQLTGGAASSANSTAVLAVAIASASPYAVGHRREQRQPCRIGQPDGRVRLDQQLLRDRLRHGCHADDTALSVAADGHAGVTDGNSCCFRRPWTCRVTGRGETGQDEATEPCASAPRRCCAGSPGRARLREDQWRAIEALVVDRRRVLCVQRTGWGKSAVYFVATALLREPRRRRARR